VEVLLGHIADWFTSRLDYFAVFAAADSRLEGWFKAELLVLFDNLKRQGVIEAYDRELNIQSPADGKRNQVDFSVQIGEEQHLCELKALCISQAAGTPRNLHFYFRDDGVGIIKDLRKLDALRHKNSWLLAFVYPEPALADWLQVTSNLPVEFRHWQPVTSPQSPARAFFVSLWRSNRAA